MTLAHADAPPCDLPCADALETIDALDVLTLGLEQTRALADECRRFARAVDRGDDMHKVADALCRAIHRMASLEEELLYPAAREALGGSPAIAMAELEHATAREIIRQMQRTDPREARYGALVVALTDCVERHAHQEQAELFPQVRAARMDLSELGERLDARRRQLATAA